jgi:glycosyltransferase involved in cell wall biosynthesis
MKTSADMCQLAVLIPCYNEEAAIAQVVQSFRQALPDATIYVYDNNSKDRTIEFASQQGAVVRSEERQGKGNVVRRMFSDIDADAYVLVDGDATYDAASARAMVDALFAQNLDMVVGTRVHSSADAYRRGHQFGNALLTNVVAGLFGRSFSDILSGYRVFSRRFVKSFPALSEGFEIETELTVHALGLRLPVSEVRTPYGVRPEGSSSKLSTYRDGFRILKVIIGLYRHEQPIRFFGMLAALLAIASVTLGVPVVLEWLQTGLVPRLPTAVLSASVMLLSALLLTVGLVLQTVTLGRREVKRLTYLGIPLMPQHAGRTTTQTAPYAATGATQASLTGASALHPQ